MATRANAVTVRMSLEEVAMLHALAEREGVSISDFIRLHVRRSFEAMRPPMFADPNFKRRALREGEAAVRKIKAAASKRPKK